MSPELSLLFRRLLRSHHRPDGPDSSDVEDFLNIASAASAAATSGGDADDDGGAKKTPLEEKRADARRCFYHAVNCW